MFISHTDRIGQTLDAAAATTADFLHDASQGRQLIATQNRTWFVEGRTMARTGQPFAHCWNPYQRRGWRYEQGVICDTRLWGGR